MTADDLYSEAEQLRLAGDYDQAAGKLRQILADDEGHVLAHLALSVVLGKLGQHEDAIQHALTACDLDPSDSFNFTALSVTYKRAYDGTQDPKYIQLAEDAMARAHTASGP